MEVFVYELLRIPLPRTWVNKGKRKPEPLQRVSVRAPAASHLCNGFI
jgi:hypothetical protein